MAEGARLESVFTRKGNVGSNPTLSAITFGLKGLDRISSTVSSIGELEDVGAAVIYPSCCPGEMVTHLNFTQETAWKRK